MKRIGQLLFSVVVVIPFSYFALGYEGEREVMASIIILSLLAAGCVYDILQLFLWSGEYKRPPRVERRKVSKEEIKAAKEIWEREERR